MNNDQFLEVVNNVGVITAQLNAQNNQNMSEKALVAQLLVTEGNITEVVNKIFVKKSDIKDPRVIESLRHLCAVNDTNDPIRQLAIFTARKEILENSSEIYALQGEDKLFDECTNELTTIVEILKKHTIVR